MMKKWSLLLAAGLLLSVAVTGCQKEEAGTAVTSAQESAAAETSVQAAETTAQTAETSAAETEKETGPIHVPNPMEPAAGVEELNALGLKMSLPENAENPGYFIISSVVGEMDFTLDGAVYCFRGSATAQDFSGIFEEFEEEEKTVLLDQAGEACEIRIRTTVSGGRLADWSLSHGKYTLYTADEVTDEVFEGLAADLAGKTCEGEQQ